jgi:hypothetical protein
MRAEQWGIVKPATTRGAWFKYGEFDARGCFARCERHEAGCILIERAREVRRRERRCRAGLDGLKRSAAPDGCYDEVIASREAGHPDLAQIVRPCVRRVHECVFGVLALEREPVDPKL